MRFGYSSDARFTWANFYDALTRSFHEFPPREVRLVAEATAVEEGGMVYLEVAGLSWRFKVVNPGQAARPGEPAEFEFIVERADQPYAGPGLGEARVLTPIRE